MADLTKRLQLLLSEEEYAFLKALAFEKKRSVAQLIRDAVVSTYRPSVSLSRKGVLRELELESFLPVPQRGENGVE